MRFCANTVANSGNISRSLRYFSEHLQRQLKHTFYTQYTNSFKFMTLGLLNKINITSKYRYTMAKFLYGIMYGQWAWIAQSV
jgi:hypothetical protein